MALQPGHSFARPRQGTLKLQHQARFAHPGLAGDAHDLPPPGLHFMEPLTQRGQFPLSSNQRREAALHRMELDGWIDSEWGQSENNRRAKFYKLTAKGRKALQQEASHWRDLVQAIARVMETV